MSLGYNLCFTKRFTARFLTNLWDFSSGWTFQVSLKLSFWVTA